jgi:group I intron endonuclease
MVIYKTTNLITGKFYVGKDKYNNPNYLGSGIKIKDAIKNYGKQNFIKEILEYCNSYEHMNQKEKYWIEKYNSTNSFIGYNISSGGDGGDTFTNHPNKELYRKRISEASSETNKKLLNKRRIDSLKLWQQNSYKENVKKGLEKAMKKQGYKIEWEKINKEVQNRPEVRKKKSEVQKGSNNSRWLGRIIITDTEDNIIVYETAKDAAEKLKTTAHLIREHCRNKTTFQRGLYKKWKFRFENEIL